MAYTGERGEGCAAVVAETGTSHLAPSQPAEVVNEKRDNYGLDVLRLFHNDDAADFAGARRTMCEMNVSDMSDEQLCTAISEEDFKSCLEKLKKCSWSQSVPVLLLCIKDSITADETERLSSLKDKHNQSLNHLIDFISKKPNARLKFIESLTKSLDKPAIHRQLMEEFRQAIRASQPCRVELVEEYEELAVVLRPDEKAKLTDRDKMLLCPECDCVMVRPVLLKCLHSLCRGCVEKLNHLASNSGSSKPSTPVDGGQVHSQVALDCDGKQSSTAIAESEVHGSSHSFRCPECDEVHSGELVENRHVTFGIILLAERLKGCQCRRCSKAVASNEGEMFHCSHCSHCSGYFCSSCAQACSDNGHTLHEREAFIVQSVLTCKEHDLPLEFLCVNCKAWLCNDYPKRTCGAHELKPFSGFGPPDSRAQIEELHDQIGMRIECVDRLLKSLTDAHQYGTSILDSKDGCILEQGRHVVTRFQSLLDRSQILSTPENPTTGLTEQCDNSFSERRMSTPGDRDCERVGQMPAYLQEDELQLSSLTCDGLAPGQPLSLTRNQRNPDKPLQTNDSGSIISELAEQERRCDHEDFGTLMDEVSRLKILPSSVSQRDGSQDCSRHQCVIGEKAFREISAKIVGRLTKPLTKTMTEALYAASSLNRAEMEHILAVDDAFSMASRLIGTLQIKGINGISELYRLLKKEDCGTYELFAELLQNSKRCKNPTHFLNTESEGSLPMQ